MCDAICLSRLLEFVDGQRRSVGLCQRQGRHAETAVNGLCYYTAVRLRSAAWRRRSGESTVCPQKSDPLNILQQQPQVCCDLNKILHTQDDICYKHYYTVSYKSALTLLKYEFLNNITHKS